MGWCNLIFAAIECSEQAAILIVTVSLWSIYIISHFDLRPGWLAGGLAMDDNLVPSAIRASRQ